MTLEQLLALLGCSNVAEAATVIARMNAFIADAKATTGKSATGDSLDSMKTRAGFAADVEKALDATGPSALGKIEALKTASARVNELEGQVKASAKAVADRDAKDVIDQATAKGKIKPAGREAVEAFYAKHGIEGLRAFVDALPESSAAPSQEEIRQPAPGGHQTAAATAEDKALAKALGKSEKDLAESVKFWSENKGEVSTVEMAALNAKAPRMSRDTARASS